MLVEDAALYHSRLLASASREPIDVRDATTAVHDDDDDDAGDDDDASDDTLDVACCAWPAAPLPSSSR